MARFIQEGRSIDYTPQAEVAAGEIVKIGNNFFGVALRGIAAGALGALRVDGVVEAAKGSGTINAGSVCFWDADAENVTTTPVENGYFGRAIEASSGAFVYVLLNGTNIGTVTIPEAQSTPAVTQNAIAALTAVNPTVDAADPSIAAVDPAEMTAKDPTVVDPVTDTITGSDYTGQAAIIKLAIEANTTAVKAVEAELEKLIDDVTAVRTQLVAAIADLATLRDSDKAIIDDVQAIETSLEAGIVDLATLKTSANAAKTDLASVVSGLTTAGLFE